MAMREILVLIQLSANRKPASVASGKMWATVHRVIQFIQSCLIKANPQALHYSACRDVARHILGWY